jgi:hypothetical protein
MRVDYDLGRLTSPVIDRITELFQKRRNEFPELFAGILRVLVEEQERRGSALDQCLPKPSAFELPALGALQSRRAILWCVGLQHYYDAQGFSGAAALFHAIAKGYQRALSAGPTPASRASAA